MVYQLIVTSCVDLIFSTRFNQLQKNILDKYLFVLGYGMSEPCGHIDFYPNNGKEQPGCDLTETPLPLTLIKEGIEEASRVLVACNHVRAIKLFIESINSKCPYVAHKCNSYQNFLQVIEYICFCEICTVNLYICR